MPYETRKFLETGLSEEYKGIIEGRDAAGEIVEDIKLYEFIVLGLEVKIREILGKKEKLNFDKNDLKLVDEVNSYLQETKNLLGKITSQGELFETTKDVKGKEKSVKLIDLEKAKEKTRKLFVAMSGFENLGEKVTRPFIKSEEFTKALYGGKEQFHDRYFSQKVAEKEKNLSLLVGGETAIFGSGMAAIETVLKQEKLKAGEKILVGKNFYSQTKEILNDYKEMETEVIEVDTGKTEEVIKILKEKKPKLLMLETIANAPTMETAEVEKLMEAVKAINEETGKETKFIIDNTFLTPQLQNILEKAKNVWQENLSPIVVIESATKYYQWGLDNINCGLVYSDNEKYIEDLKKTRAKIGTNLSGKLAAFLPELSKELWEKKMRRHSDNALLLAKSLENFSNKLEVSYPGLESHRDYETIKKEYKGAGGLMFLKLKEGIDGETMVDKIKEEAEKEGVAVNIGGSFGHPETWLAPMNKGNKEKPKWVIRVAVGAENIGDFKKVVNIFEKVFAGIE